MHRHPLVRPLLALTAAAVVLTPLGPVTAQAATSDFLAPTLLRDGQAGSYDLAAELPVQADTTVEPSIAVNPGNPLNAVAGYQEGRVDAGGDANNGFATTKDGGRTWVHGEIPGLTKASTPAGAFDRASDAVVAFGPGNTVYYSSLVFNDDTGQGLRSSIVNSTSHDGGLTWDLPTVVIDDQAGGLNDKNWEVVDNASAPGHHLGRVYVGWDRIAPVLAAYSDDQGATWSLPSVVSPSQGIGSIPVVLANGGLAIVYLTEAAPAPGVATAPEDLAEAIAGISKFVVSTAPLAGTVLGGAPLVFGPAVSVAPFTGSPVRQQRAGGLVSADVDPLTGRLYVGFEDTAGRSDAANDAAIVTSDDDGLTWTAPLIVNPHPATGLASDNLDHYDVALAASPQGLRVMWRQRQEAATTAGFATTIDTLVASSTDGGRTFSAPLQVNTGPSDSRYAAFSRGGVFQGDYNQIAIAGGITYVVRCESYADRPGQVAVLDVNDNHQTTWVAVLGAPGADALAADPVVPEVPLPALAGFAAAGMLALAVRRRRTA